MPRIRTLKPEHRTHRKVGALDDRTYRLWVGLLCEADDDGRLVCDAEQLRVIIFGYQVKVTAAMVEQGLARLVEIGLLRFYGAAEVRYAYFPSWREHQWISHRSPSKLPEPVDVPDSSGALRSPPEHSSLIKDQGSRIKEGIKDQGVTTLSGSAADARRRLNGLADAEGVLQFLNQKTGRNFRLREAGGKPSANLALIEARLRGGATVIQCRAIILRKYHEWKGDEKMAHFLRPETLFGRTKFEQYLGELPAQKPKEDA